MLLSIISSDKCNGCEVVVNGCEVVVKGWMVVVKGWTVVVNGNSDISSCSIISITTGCRVDGVRRVYQLCW